MVTRPLIVNNVRNVHLADSIMVSDCLLADSTGCVPFFDVILLICVQNAFRLYDWFRIAFGITKSSNYPSNTRFGYSESLCQLPVRKVGCSVKIPDFFSLFIGQFSIPTVLSKICSSPGVPSSFIPHISNVFLVGSKPEVGWIDAPRTISIRTIVADAKTVWNWTKMQNPRCFVRENGCASINPYPSIRISVSQILRSFGAGPQPAGIRKSDLGKKPFWEVFGKTLRSQILGRNLLHRQFVCGCGLLAPAASSL